MPVKQGAPATLPNRTKPLTTMQLLFMDKFVKYTTVDRMERQDAAIQAATDAGYNNPKSTAALYLGNVSYLYIREEINRRVALYEAAIKAEQEINAERIIKELGQIAFHNPKTMIEEDGNVKDVSKMDDATARCMMVTGFNVVKTVDKFGKPKVIKRLEVRPYSKLKALDQLALVLGLKEGKGATQNKTTVNVQWAEIFGPAAAPPQNGIGVIDAPDALEERIKAEEAKALPEMRGNPVLYKDGKNGKMEDDEYV